MRALLDTSILIAQVSQSEPVPDLSEYQELTVSTLSWTELLIGVHSVQDALTYKRRQRELDRLQKFYGTGLPFTDSCAQELSLLIEEAVAQGAQAKSHRFDRMIAATARLHGLTLVTRNPKDFHHFQHLVKIAEA